MRVMFTGTGEARGLSRVVEMDAVPRVGETIQADGVPPGDSYVRTVAWTLDEDADDSLGIETPYVYVVIGPRRPE